MSCSKGGLSNNFNRLLEKHIKMMDKMTMEDIGFQQRVLQRMIELQVRKQDEEKGAKHAKASNGELTIKSKNVIFKSSSSNADNESFNNSEMSDFGPPC